MLRVVLRAKTQRSRVDAVAQAGGLRSIVEHVAEVGVAVGAGDLGAHHAMRQVTVLVDAFASQRQPETGPAAARVELLRRLEQVRAAADAVVGPPLRMRRILTREGAFRALLLRDVVLKRGQAGAQFLARGLAALAHRCQVFPSSFSSRLFRRRAYSPGLASCPCSVSCA